MFYYKIIKKLPLDLRKVMLSKLLKKYSKVSLRHLIKGNELFVV
jgi:hypothetical protein